jgi:exportin-2 (importin alpha re-exporter)
MSGTPTTLLTFKQALLGPFTIIIQQEIECELPLLFGAGDSLLTGDRHRIYPCVYQILTQILKLHTADVPTDYCKCYRFSYSRRSGNIPRFVKLLKAFLARDSKQIVAAGQVAAVLGIIQQRWIRSGVSDV